MARIERGKLATRLNAFGVEGSHYIDCDGGFSRIYRLEKGLNLIHYSDSQIDSVFQSIERLFSDLEASISVQFFMSQTFEKGKHAQVNQDKSLGLILSEVVKERKKYLENKSFRQKTLYMILSWNQKTLKRSSMKSSTFRLFPKEDSVSFQIDRLDHAEMAMSELFKQCKLTVNRLEGEQILSYLNHLINDKEVDEINPNYLLREQLCVSHADYDRDYLHYDDTYIKTLTLHSLPEDISELWSVYNADFLTENCQISLSFSRSNETSIKSTVELRYSFYQFLEMSGLVKKEIDSETAVNKSSQLKEVIQKLSKKDVPFQLRFLLIIRDKTKENLKKRSDFICMMMKQKFNLKFIDDTYNHLDNYFSCLPNQGYTHDREHYVFSDQIPYFLPYGEGFKGTSDPQVLLESHNGNLVPFSFIKNEAPASHSIVIGGTGGGKSFSMNFLLLQIKSNDPLAYISIIDKGASYKKLCTLLKGSYIQVEVHEDYAIELFPNRSLIMTEKGLDSDQQLFINQYIQLFIKDDSQPYFSKSDEYLINRCINHLYEHHESPLLKDFEQSLDLIEKDKEDEIRAEKWIKNLRLFTKEDSPYACLFNKKGSLDLSNDFLVFDITKLEQHPRIAPIYLQVMTNCLRLRMFGAEKTQRRQYIVRDEVWALLKDKTSAKIIEEDYRTARKYGTILLSVSQGTDDFVGAESVPAILKNSHLKFFLPNEEDSNSLKKFDLNDQQIHLIQNLNNRGTEYRQLFLKYSNIDSEVFNIRATDLEYSICSRDYESQELLKQVDYISETELLDRLKQGARR